MTKEEVPYFSNPGDMIQYHRKAKGLTIIELAQRMGVSQSYIVNIEQQNIYSTREQIEVLCSFIEGENNIIIR